MSLLILGDSFREGLVVVGNRENRKYGLNNGWAKGTLNGEKQDAIQCIG